MAPPLVLAGDVGGTHTRLALFGPGETAPLHTAVYASSAHPDFESIVADFLADFKAEPVAAAAVAVAGPVIDGRSALTNLPWRMDAQRLAERLGTPRVQLINDQVGLAYFVARQGDRDCAVLQAGEGQVGGVMAILAPGTGLGQGFISWQGSEFTAHPSEGGHADFAPVNARQIRLLEYMLGRHRRVSVERVCSGMGLPALYDFLREIEQWPEPAWLRDELAGADDPTAVIVGHSQQPRPGAEICLETVRLFVEILAQEAGNLCLKVLPRGGLFLGGGLPPRILAFLQQGFGPVFGNKGRMSPLLANLPVYVITHPQPTLQGAGWCAARLLEPPHA